MNVTDWARQVKLFVEREEALSQIPKLYPPGSIGLRLNGQPPAEFEILNGGDKVELSVGCSVN